MNGEGVEGVWNLGGMGMLNCMRTSIENISLCTSVSGSGGVGDSAVVDGIDGVGTGGGFGSGCGNSDGAENIGVS